MKAPLLVWGDPPPTSRRGSPLKHAAVITALKERPGQWACVQRGPERKSVYNLGGHLRGKGYTLLARPYKLEIAVRQTPTGDHGVWARVVEADS